MHRSIFQLIFQSIFQSIYQSICQPCRNLAIPTSSDMESGSLRSRERQVNEYDNGICSQTKRLKTKDKRQKTAPGNCLIYPSFIHSFTPFASCTTQIHFPLHPVQMTFPNGISHSLHNGINGISHIGTSHDILHTPA